MPETMPSTSVLMVAGEASADVHGAQVLQALRQRHGPVTAFGIGGAAARAAGLATLYRAEDIALAGLTEVVFALPRLFGMLRQLARLAQERRPRVAVLIDMPDFNLPLARRLKALGIPVIYYISPQVWAWRAGRVKQIRRLVDRMLVVLPFEEAWYRARSVDALFVGHPLLDELPTPGGPAQQQAARAQLQLGQQVGPVLALLPGSRREEVARHLPPMLAAVALLRKADHPSLCAVLPVASTVAPEQIAQLVRDAGVDVVVVQGHSDEALLAADAALVCSGTATLQAALLERPMVVVYRVSWLSYLILRHLIRVAHIGLVNLIAQARLVPELVQEALTPEALAAAVAPQLTPGPTRELLVRRLSALRRILGTRRPASTVADILASYLHASPVKEPPHA